MRVLLTNDDGIHAEGLHALRRQFSAFADVCVVAPMQQQSGTAHSITLFHPLRVRQMRDDGGLYGYAVDGSPADCVKIGVRNLLEHKPDLVISGINPGGNIGTNVLYSGTVSAAMEALMLGIPAMAVSIDSFTVKDYSFAAKTAENLARALEKNKYPRCLLNVNMPDIEAKKIKGLKLTHQGNLRFVERYDKRLDPRNESYYWLDGELIDEADDPDSDSGAVSRGYVSVTPLGFNLTDNAVMKTAAAMLDEIR